MDRFLIQVPRHVPRFKNLIKTSYYYFVPRVSRLFTQPNQNTLRVSSSMMSQSPSGFDLTSGNCPSMDTLYNMTVTGRVLVHFWCRFNTMLTQNPGQWIISTPRQLPAKDIPLFRHLDSGSGPTRSTVKWRVFNLLIHGQTK